MQAANSVNYLLVMLGTNTNYSSVFSDEKRNEISKACEKSPLKDIVLENARTDSLCFIAEMLAGQKIDNQERLQPHIHSAQFEHADIINGPDPLGYEVYNRVALSLLITLSRLLDGKTNLQFLGHSRGAVQTILLMHALQKIKDILNTEDNPDIKLSDIQAIFAGILNKNNMFWLGQFFKQGDSLTEEFSKLIKKDQISLLNQNLNAANIHVITIDPVPGFGWRDSDMNQKLPNIVNQYYQFIPNNEYSEGFDALVPKDLDEKDKLFIDGHHGTCSGNIWDQRKQMWFENQLQAGYNPEAMHAIPDYFILFTLNTMQERNFEFKSVEIANEIKYEPLKKVFLDFVGKFNTEKILNHMNTSDFKKSIDALKKYGGSYLGFRTGKNNRQATNPDAPDNTREIKSGLEFHLNYEHLNLHQKRFLSELQLLKPFEKVQFMVSFLAKTSLTNKNHGKNILTESVCTISNKLYPLSNSKINLGTDADDAFITAICNELDHVLQEYLKSDNPKNDAKYLKKIIKALNKIQSRDNDNIIIKKILTNINTRVLEQITEVQNLDITNCDLAAIKTITLKAKYLNQITPNSLDKKIQELKHEKATRKKSEIEKYKSEIQSLKQQIADQYKDNVIQVRRLQHIIIANSTFSAISIKVLKFIADVILHLLLLTVVFWQKVYNKRPLSFFKPQEIFATPLLQATPANE